MTSPTPEPPLPNDAESFTPMATTADPFQAGVHCAFCHQLDFLPFRCESCKSQFCKDHRTETSHACTNAGAWARARRDAATSSSSSSTPKKPSILTHEAQCADPHCKTLIDTPLVQGIACPHCNRRYCLKHRMREAHSCDKLEPLGGRPTKPDRGIGDALGRLRAWGAQKKQAAAAAASSSSSSSPSNSKTTPTKKSPSEPTTPLQRIISPFTSAATAARKSSSSQSAQIVALNALKRTAKGDSKIPPEKRLYFKIEAVGEGEGRAGAKIPSATAFYDRAWSVGRLLDAAAKLLAVENVNNKDITEERRLRVFWIEGGRLLQFSEKLGEVKGEGNGMGLGSGHTLVLLRGVGPLDT